VPRPAHGAEPEVLDLAPQPLERTRPRRPDAALRHPERGPDLVVAGRRVRGQHAQERAVTRSQPVEGLPEEGVALVVEQHGRRLRRGVGGRLVDRLRDRADATAVAQDRQAFSAGGRRQPGSDALGLPDAVQALDEADERDLDDVGGVGVIEPVRPGDRPHDAGELVDDGVPGAVVTRSGSGDQAHHGVRGQAGA
jgi:hypothetical protein